MLGKNLVSAQITLAGVELLRRIRQGQFAFVRRSRREGTAGGLDLGSGQVVRGTAGEATPTGRLSTCQLEVAQLVTSGKSNNVIAEALS